MPADADLLNRVRAHDPAALAELYDRYAPRLYAYLYRRLGDQALAEDLVSEVFVRALEALRRDRFARTALQAWLYRLAHNRLIDYYRQNGLAAPLPLDESAPAGDDVPAAAAAATAQADVRAALLRLTAEQQQIITLRFGEGLSAPAVAAVLGKPETAIRSLQHRALAALRRLLPEDDHER